MAPKQTTIFDTNEKQENNCVITAVSRNLRNERIWDNGSRKSTCDNFPLFENL